MSFSLHNQSNQPSYTEIIVASPFLEAILSSVYKEILCDNNYDVHFNIDTINITVNNHSIRRVP